MGTPDNLVLRGNAFPVIVAQDGVGVMAAAARVSDAGGKVVAFNKVWRAAYCWPLLSLKQWTSQNAGPKFDLITRSCYKVSWQVHAPTPHNTQCH